MSSRKERTAGDDYLGDVKQEIIRCYNQVNQRIFNIGTKWVKVELSDHYIFVIAKHRRVAGNAIVDQKLPILSRMVDVVLLDEFKESLNIELSRQLNLDIETVLKDYDPLTELAGTLIVLNKPL
ncbi:hypothetical protein CEB3_c00380 [Peptococcaceae bacterium CEB3]|nr:hypothetical protein CEB3_c00380 [Peptococcaceae bacterium CEB3]